VNLTSLLAGRQHILLDFDGPVCAVFGAVSARDTAQQLAASLTSRGVRLPAGVADTDDPFDVLRAAGHAAKAAEVLLRDLELRAVRAAPLTPGIRDALNTLNAAGHTITIVSNNSDAAVRALLAGHQLAPPISAVVARTEPDPGLLKPHPHLVQRAIELLRTTPDACVLIGDSTTDILAARAAGTAVIAYANKHDKRDGFAAYRPDAIIDSITDITEALTTDNVTPSGTPATD
jgi:HAD superfamily hydrolase (TIGR01662 family)